jgi:predicted ATP-dependent endonuclease of OLD family
MKLSRVRLRNFRCYKEEISFDFNNLTLMIGRNDVGKSTVLEALNIFFDEAKIETEDATVDGDVSDVAIICEFSGLPSEIDIDAGNKTSFGDEFLLNKRGYLELQKIYNCSTKTPKATFYANANHPTGENLNDLLTLTNAKLKQRAKLLGIALDSVNQAINSQLRQKIWRDSDITLKMTLIPLDKAAEGKIWDQIKKILPTFALFKSDRPSTDQDAEAQDPMKAAIQEAIKAQEVELSEIAVKVEAEVRSIADRTVEKLKEMDATLAGQLKPRFSKPNWAKVFGVSLTDDNEIPINKRGSGVRRLILLNFFRAKAEEAARERGSTNVIYAIEEPETSQHPANQRLLMRAFSELVANPDCQVILTTHNPVLARLVPIEAIRYICSTADCRLVESGSPESCKALAKELGILADHSVKLFIGVEGINDIDFLKGISQILAAAGEDILDLGQLEEDGVIIFIPCGGTNLALWANRLADLNRPEFHLFDRDSEPPNTSKYQATVDEINARDDCTACLTTRKEMENYLHPLAIKSEAPDFPNAIAEFDDVPFIFAQVVHAASDSDTPWGELDEKKQKKKMSNAKRRLNSASVRAMTPELLTEADPADEVRGWFRQISLLIQE